MLSLDRTAPPVIDWVMLALPWFGTNLTLAPIIGAFSLWVWRARGRGDLALQLMITVLGGLILNAVSKDLFDRPRPELWPHRGQYQWASYPSGHAIVGVAVFFMVARLTYRERRWRWPFVVAAILLVVSLYSRVYLGVHWPTDVIGGILMGAAWLASVIIAFRPLERIRERAARPPRPNPMSVPGRSSTIKSSQG
jgi:undecaprenyl-diphosphatase